MCVVFVPASLQHHTGPAGGRWLSRWGHPTLTCSRCPTKLIKKIVIATRESRLALWQANHVKGLLQERLGWRVELLGMTTLGDLILDR